MTPASPAAIAHAASPALGSAGLVTASSTATMSSPTVSTPRVTVNTEMRRLCRPPKKSATPQHADAPRAVSSASKRYGVRRRAVGGGGAMRSSTVVIVSCPIGPAGAGSAPTWPATASPVWRTGLPGPDGADDGGGDGEEAGGEGAPAAAGGVPAAGRRDGTVATGAPTRPGA